MAVLLYPSLAIPVLPPELEPEQVTESRWHQPWADPRQTIFGKVARGYAVALIASGMAITDPNGFTAEPTLESKFHEPWSEPIRLDTRPARLHAAYQQAATVDPTALTQAEAVLESKWHQPWSQPYLTTVARSRIALIASGAVIDPYALTQPEEITESRWHQPWSEPQSLKVKLSQQLRVALQPTTTIDPYALTQAETVSEDKWHQPWSEPRRSKVERYLSATAQHYFEFAPEPPEFQTVSWFAPLSEPVRLKPRLITGAQRDVFTGFVPLVSFSWYHGFSEPVRVKPGLAVYDQPFYAAEPEPEELDVEAWYHPLSLPVRVKPGLRKDLQQTLTIPYGFGTPYGRGYVIT